MIEDSRLPPPGARGVYALAIELERRLSARIGALGIITFDPGVYVYVGSALGKGPTSLRGRLARHLGRRRRLKWHIDWLLSTSGVNLIAIVYGETDRKLECELARTLLQTGFEVAAKRFGSSDCRCPSHLLRWPGGGSWMDALLEAFRRLGLEPRVIQP